MIHDWTAAEVWEYIRARNLAYCKLYDEGKKRIGCVFCPFARERENIENALKYPQFVRYFITACDRAIKNHLAKGKESKYKTGAEMFVGWIEGGRGKKLKDFGVKFDYEKGELVMENDMATIASTTAIVPAGSAEVASTTITLEKELKELEKLTTEQLTIEAKIYFQQHALMAMEFGKRLIVLKKRVGHGNWTNWLDENFKLKKSTAANFMAIAERFSNLQTFGNLGYSQMVQMIGKKKHFLRRKKPQANQQKIKLSNVLTKM